MEIIESFEWATFTKWSVFQAVWQEPLIWTNNFVDQMLIQSNFVHRMYYEQYIQIAWIEWFISLFFSPPYDNVRQQFNATFSFWLKQNLISIHANTCSHLLAWTNSEYCFFFHFEKNFTCFFFSLKTWWYHRIEVGTCRSSNKKLHIVFIHSIWVNALLFFDLILFRSITISQ